MADQQYLAEEPMDESAEYLVYMSGPLSNLTEKQLAEAVTVYNAVSSTCKKLGFTCYLPHRAVYEPNNAATPASVYVTDSKRVKQAKVVVAYLPPSTPSYGVGLEIGIAQAEDIDVIPVFHASDAKRVNRFVLGAPVVARNEGVCYTSLDSLQEMLYDRLRYVISGYFLKEVSREQGWPFSTYALLKQQLDRMRDALAARKADYPLSAEAWISIQRKLSSGF